MASGVEKNEEAIRKTVESIFRDMVNDIVDMKIQVAVDDVMFEVRDILRRQRKARVPKANAKKS